MRRLALALAAFTAACVPIADTFPCTSDAQCTAGGAGPGHCGPAGYCAFPDSSCGELGYRYDASAGNSAGICEIGQGSSVSLPTIDLRSAAPTPDSCGPSGAHAVSFEVSAQSAGATLVVETVSPTTTTVAISIHAGACPASGYNTACSLPSCDTTPYGRLVTTLPEGPSCVVVAQQASSSTAPTVTLQVSQYRGQAILLGSGAGATESATGTTCAHPIDTAVESCVPPGSLAAAAVLETCPADQHVHVTVTPLPPAVDIVLILHAFSTIGPELACIDGSGETGSGGDASTTINMDVPTPTTWLMIESKNVGECGAFMITDTP